MKPLIGITMYNSETMMAGEPVRVAMLPNLYMAAVRRAGGCPVLLPAGGDYDEAADAITAVDGLVLPGGTDIHPRAYGQPLHFHALTPDLIRDGWEHYLAVQARALNVPLLGICRGMQMINVSYGGSLHQHLRRWDRHMPDGTGFSTHKVNIEPETRLADILDGAPSVDVKTRHHQAVNTLGGGLRPVAWTEDGTIEAVEADEPWRFLLGVQWHPEQGEDHRVFEALVEASAAQMDSYD